MKEETLMLTCQKIVQDNIKINIITYIYIYNFINIHIYEKYDSMPHVFTIYINS